MTSEAEVCPGLRPIIQAKNAHDDLLKSIGHVQITGTPAERIARVFIMMEFSIESGCQLANGTGKHNLARRGVRFDNAQMMFTRKHLYSGQIRRIGTVLGNICLSACRLTRLPGVYTIIASQAGR